MTSLSEEEVALTLKKSEIRVCLRVMEFECSPHEITRIIGITPCRTWLKGDAIDKTGRATIKHKQNGWEICSRAVSDNANYYSELQPCVSKILDIVRPCRDNFKSLPTGVFIQLSCFIYAYSEKAPAINIDSVSVNELSHINASIDIDYYIRMGAG